MTTTIYKEQTLNHNMKEYYCVACAYHFTSDDDEPYCPSCDNTNLEIIDYGEEDDQTFSE